MSFYADRILPHLIHRSMRSRELLAYRRRAIAQAGGVVLEIGCGSGLNFPHYGQQVSSVCAVEPAARLRRMAQEAAAQSCVPVSVLNASAEALPLDSHSVDTVISTWTLCSIAQIGAALEEMRRVLKREGQLVFVEHGLAVEPSVQAWQRRLTPLCRAIGGGCHLDRPISALLSSAGFRIARLYTGYAPGVKSMAFFYEGCAVPTEAA